MPQTVLFYLISFALIAFAIGVVTARSAVYGVLSLVGALGMMACLFMMLKAYLVATVLLLVYAGAILVLFLFVVMLIDFRKLSFDWHPFKTSPVFAFILAVLFLVEAFYVISRTSVPGAAEVQGTAEAVGKLLFLRHVLPFELTSFLILAAVVSVVVLAKKDAE